MINQITCNSNNSIELSRSELLHWVNGLLKANYTKVEQLGTGAAYCQILDIMCPGKVPLAKVNCKAKSEYEYINNFKVLQQCFVKLHILRNIEVEKLVKCKCQDNLQFLQWFKKIFDSLNNNCQPYDVEPRRGNISTAGSKEKKINKENSFHSLRPNISDSGVSDDILPLAAKISRHEQAISAHSVHSRPLSETDHEKTNISVISAIEDLETGNEQMISRDCKFIAPHNCIDAQLLELVHKNQQEEEKSFYLNKVKQIEQLMGNWDRQRSSRELIREVRNIIFLVPRYNIETGEVKTVATGETVATQPQTQQKLKSRAQQQYTDETSPICNQQSGSNVQIQEQ